MDVQEEAAERYDRLPWEHLVPPPDPDRRRWLVGGVIVVVAGAFLGFRAGSGTAAVPPPPSVAVAVDDGSGSPAVDSTDTLPADAQGPTTPPPVAAPLAANTAAAPDPGSAAIVSGIQRSITEALSGPGVFVDRVLVHGGDSRGHVAVISLYEVVDGVYIRAPDIAVEVRARQEGATVVVDEVVPIPVPEARMSEPLGEVETVPDPVSDALRESLTIWPGSDILRVGNDTRGWWAEVGVALPGGSVVPLVIRPTLPVGTGSGG